MEKSSRVEPSSLVTLGKRKWTEGFLTDETAFLAWIDTDRRSPRIARFTVEESRMLKFLRMSCPFAGAALALLGLAGEARATYGGGAVRDAPRRP